MANKTIDHIGQEVEVGDWCAVTQNNSITVGKVIRTTKGGNVTIEKKFNGYSMSARDGKFIKIKPTAKMEMEYDVKKTKP